MEAITTPTATAPTPQDLEKALFFAHDAFERALCPFFPTGKTAWAIKHNEWLSGDKISLGIRYNDFVAAKNILPEAVRIAGGGNIDIQDKKIHIEYERIPIDVRIIKKHYRFLDFLDPVFYAYETFYLPNPFESYWVAYKWMH